MDPIEELFSAFADPDVDKANPGSEIRFKDENALEKFTRSTEQPDNPDDTFLRSLLNPELLRKPNLTIAMQVRQHLAEFAVRQNIKRKDTSHKAQQMKYYRWMAQGKKEEAYPFANTKTIDQSAVKELPSTTRLLSLVNLSTCGFCGKEGANMRCPGCNISDDEHVVKRTAYCNKTCFQQHQKAHRPICDARRNIHRAVTLLDIVFFAMMEATKVHPLKEVFEEHGILYTLYSSWDRSAFTGRSIFTPIPKDIYDSADIRRAVIASSEAAELHLSLASLVPVFLKPICKSIEYVEYFPKNMRLPVCNLDVHGSACSVALRSHPVWCLTLPGGEKYAMDLTAARFGWKETLAPWGAFKKVRLAKQVRTENFGFKDKAALDTINASDVLYYQRSLRQELVKEFTKKLDVMMAMTGGEYAITNIVKSSDAAFGRMKEEMYQLVRESIRLLRKNIAATRKDHMRLCYTTGPQYDLRVACCMASTFKTAWMKEKEYDDLLKEGADIHAIWDERIGDKLKNSQPCTADKKC
ncbi:hypothetical protein F5Y16DRAFT_6150 [Xylariaceae sp. FL0255]|nr:hypothetical protein F5Y16DRAFT_6150 [Xylariaceae sp. FL0255]